MSEKGMTFTDKFKPYQITVGVVRVSVTKNGMNFSKSTVSKLGNPKSVVLLLNDEDCQMAVKVCGGNDDRAVKFAKGDAIRNIRLNSKDLMNTIEKMAGWDLRKQGYKIKGEYISTENAVLFDLRKGARL